MEKTEAIRQIQAAYSGKCCDNCRHTICKAVAPERVYGACIQQDYKYWKPVTKVKRAIERAAENQVNEDNPPLGTVIRKFRQEHGITLEMFANSLGCTKAFLAAVEENTDAYGREPAITLGFMKRVAKLMGITLAELIGKIKV